MTPTIADHSTHCLFTAVHLAAQIADRVLQLLGHVADGASGADDEGGRIGSSVPCRQGDRLVALGIVAQVLRLRVTRRNVFVLGSTLSPRL